ncbi:sigma-70 family RNA polymerase sigma factor [Neobacillus sp. MER 74]|uniref:sigma-70 family RNA polymerase sigma factor n=1 Tax=Neobacillus sp. MER 74 TaxID=2939566 RepID=UPI002041190D|nr:sigma-70 family RNA polymerase sigma factor [Neobacillus sp. MER 74]MCM3117734.1 sigma-70 family RNA polymerase sigma factor [Neobacillus sp. MER 74]
MESFEQLVDQYQPMLHKIINSLHLYKNHDEFYQHSLIALWEASQRFDPNKGSFTNYAYTYIKGCLLMELKKAHQDHERNVHPGEEFWDLVEDSHSDDPLQKETLLTYCETLTPNQQKWLLYTVRDQLSIKEIAELENVSPSAVKSWRSGAREKLKKIVRD